MAERSLVGEDRQLLEKRGKAVGKNCDFENNGIGRSFEQKRNGLAEVVPEVASFGFVEGDELRMLCFGKSRDAIEFPRGAIAHLGSAFDAGKFAIKRSCRILGRISLGLEEELQKLGADYIDGGRTERRALDEMANCERVFGSAKGNNIAAARGRCGKGAEVEAGDDGKRTERADQELVEIIAGDVLDDAPAALAKAAGAIDKLRANKEVPSRAVSMAKRGVHAGGDDAPDRGFEVKRDSERQELFLLVERRGQVVEIGSGIDAHGEVARIVMSDLLEAGHVEGDVVARRGHADFEFRAMTASDQGELLEGGEADDFGNLLSGSWLRDGRRRDFVDRVIAAEGRLGRDVGSADGGFETGGEVGNSTAHGMTAARRGRQVEGSQKKEFIQPTGDAESTEAAEKRAESF